MFFVSVIAKTSVFPRPVGEILEAGDVATSLASFLFDYVELFIGILFYFVIYFLGL
jgi:hypothetical protein